MSFANNFLPNSNIVSNITRANPGVVSTSSDHGYLTGLFVRIVCPVSIGMNEVLNQTFRITVLTVNTFSIGVNTSKFTSFAVSSASQSAQVIPVGNESPGLLESEQNAGNIIPET